MLYKKNNPFMQNRKKIKKISHKSRWITFYNFIKKTDSN